jgi:hypothetical protein
MELTLTKQAERFRTKIIAAWNKSVDGIFEIGDLLIAARAKLTDLEFETLRNQLPFQPDVARRLEKIASDKRLREPEIKKLLPPHWGTIEQISFCTDDELQDAVKSGVIKPEVQRKSVTAFRAKKSVAANSNPQGPAATTTPKLNEPKYHSALVLEIPEKTNNYNFFMDLLFLRLIAHSIVEKYKSETGVRLAFNPDLKIPDKINKSSVVLARLINITTDLVNHERNARKESSLTPFQEMVAVLGGSPNIESSNDLGLAAAVILGYAYRNNLDCISAENLKPHSPKPSVDPELLGGFLKEVEKAVRAIIGEGPVSESTEIISLNNSSPE